MNDPSVDALLWRRLRLQLARQQLRQQFGDLAFGELPSGDVLQRIEETTGVRGPGELARELRVINAALADMEPLLVAALCNPDTPHNLGWIQRSCGLNDIEAQLLFAASAAQIDFEVTRAFARLEGTDGKRPPSVGFLLALVRDAEAGPEVLHHCLADSASLVHLQLVKLQDERLWEQTPRALQRVTVPDRVVDLLAGAPVAVEGELARGMVLHAPPNISHPLLVDDDLRQGIASALRRSPPRLTLLGLPGTGRRSLLRELAGVQPVLEVSLEDLLPGDGATTRRRVREQLGDVVREANLADGWVLIRADGEQDVAELWTPFEAELKQAFAGVELPVVVSAGLQAFEGGWSTVIPSIVGEAPEFFVELPNRDAQVALWSRALEGSVEDDDARLLLSERLGDAYRLPPGRIFGAAASAQRRARGLRKRQLSITLAGLQVEVRRQLENELSFLADPISTEQSLDDVVLSPEARSRLDEVLDYARQAETVFDAWGFGGGSKNGRGLSVLFSGPPGTGKTMVAAILAKTLGKVLYRVDLSRVVDKYIGETEKNIGRIFDQAERAQAVLLLDEADSLMASRTDVKSSNDRYANLEVNYLLQRLDDFAGVSVLTTNRPTGIDEAFMRRIRHKVEFPMPKPDQRAVLWQALLPPQAPVAPDIDFARLGAEFELSGGHIRNAILRASILAAGRQAAIDGNQLWTSAMDELREMGKLVVDRPPFYDPSTFATQPMTLQAN